MKKVYFFVLLAALLAAAGCAVAQKKAVQTGGESDIVLPEGMEQVEYEYLDDSDATDLIYYVGVDFLKKMGISDYSNTFGAVENAREAADVAAIVFNDIYKMDPQEEAPFRVYFNEAADAWIVRGSIRTDIVFGGVFNMAIGRQAGNIIMVYHEE